MDTSRANLDQPQSNTKYILLTIILIVLSVIGVFLFLKIKSAHPGPIEPVTPAEPTPTATPPPAEVLPRIPTYSSEPDFYNAPTDSSPTQPVDSEPLEPEPTPPFQTYNSVEDGFTLSYLSDRKVYKLDENTGHRVVFYRASGNIAVHVGGNWSWQHPGRELLNSLNISGQPAFRYDISAQTLVDVKYKDRFYTIQCIHNANENLKSECEQLITSFKFL